MYQKNLVLSRVRKWRIVPATSILSLWGLKSFRTYKYPRKIEFAETLPKTVSGKIRRVELRNREWGK
jgi:acyl-coenzyme A synthetase/AMP-(fatty) acid ligase